MTHSLQWHSYKYFPYERDLAEREVKVIPGASIISNTEDELRISGDVEYNHLKRLVYFKSFSIEHDQHSTLQSLIEGSCTVNGNKKRQSTRYSAHGLHEYKGKFNPQIVRGIINSLNIRSDAKVLDPFCGSGTTLLESTHSGHPSLGLDINPLAVYVANAKQLAISTPSSELEQILLKIKRSTDRREYYSLPPVSVSTEEYLERWFSTEILPQICIVDNSIRAHGGKVKTFFFSIFSNLLRDYSLQEPADLRIRQRKTPLPKTKFRDAYFKLAAQIIDSIKRTQTVFDEIPKSIGSAKITNISDDNFGLMFKIEEKYDVAITSPPYATALPYIDTQRLSLAWLGLIDSKNLNRYEADLTGSRELHGDQRVYWNNSFENNTHELPDTVIEFCYMLQKSMGSKDGFRRKAVPVLLYRYFSNMKQMFINVNKMLKASGKFALVVGVNRTTLNNKLIVIDTPDYLVEISKQVGYKHIESITLQTYQRYGIHCSNSVQSEKLIILKK